MDTVDSIATRHVHTGERSWGGGNFKESEVGQTLKEKRKGYKIIANPTNKVLRTVPGEGAKIIGKRNETLH